MSERKDGDGDRLHMELHGLGVSRETVEQVGQAMVDLLEEVAKNIGAPQALGWQVGGILFKCDNCQRTQLFDAPRDGWEHRKGDDWCPECVAFGGQRA
jgi:hypothetical protein